MCVTCGCGGKSATYEDIKPSKKTADKTESKKEQESHVHHKKEAKKKA